MHDNTPPRVAEIEDDEGEIINFDNDIAPEDSDDELEMEEITLEELEARYGGVNEDDEDDENDTRRRSPVQDDAQITFQLHKGPIFSCSLHPNRPLAATGGEDDSAYVWNTQTGEKIFEITEHKDTVTEVHFSYDGTYLATGDMAGELYVYKLQHEGESTTLRRVWEYSMGDMGWMRWHRGANVLLAGSEEGEVYVWRIPSGECKLLPGEGQSCRHHSGAELSGDGKKLLTAYSNGILKLWDLKNCKVIMQIDNQHPMAHQEGITAVACDKESPLYMSGGEDGKIIFCSNNGPVGSVEASGPVECCAFSPSSDLKLAASGTLHGQIAIWDFAKCSLRTLCEHSELDDGITRLKWISDYTLIVSTIQGNIYGYDARTGMRKFTLSGHMADIYNFCYDPIEKILLSVSEDHTAKIFKVPQLGE